MFPFLMSESHRQDAPAGPATLPAPVRGERPKGARGVDVSGLIRQASIPVKIHHLLRSGKRDIQMLSREKVDELLNRTIRNIVEKHRATGALAGPATQRRVEAGSGQQVDDLLSQQQQTAAAQDELAGSKQALDRELQDMREDLAQQRELADGRLPGEVERSMVERRFEKLYAHLAAMDRAIGTLFSSKLYSYRQVQTLVRQATAARNSAALKTRGGVLLALAPVIRKAGGEKPAARTDSVQADPPGSRRVEPFSSMDLELGRGLDLGTVNICAAARRKGVGQTAYNLQRNAYLDVRDDAFARKMLKYGIDYVVRGERGYVIGDAAFEFANIFEKPLRRPMKDGMISSDEPDAILIVNHLVEGLLGPPQQPGEICAYSVPGDPVDDDRNFIYHRSALESVLVNMGYTPRPMLESHLIVFAELKDQDYTGIGISCGGGMVNVCVAYKGVPTLAFSTLRGGDWIDGSVAKALGMSSPLVCAIKEGGADLLNPKGRVQEAIAIYYRHFIQYTLEMMKRKMEGAQSLPTFTRPVHLVFAGGAAMIPGFIDVFREEFEKVEFPIEVEELRLARDPLKAVAGGCLQAALAETRALHEASIDVAPVVLERAAIHGIPRAGPEGALHLARLQGASALSGASAVQAPERTGTRGG